MAISLPDFAGGIQRGRDMKYRDTLSQMGLQQKQDELQRIADVRVKLSQLGTVPTEGRQQYLTSLASMGDEGMRAMSNVQSMWSGMSKEQQAMELQKAQMVGRSLKAVQDDPERYQAVRAEIARIAPKAAEGLPEEWNDRTSAIVDAYMARVDELGDSNVPARLSGFEGLAKAAGLKKGSDEYKTAALQELGAVAKAGTRSKDERIAGDTGLTESVAQSQAVIKDRVKRAEESAKNSQGQIKEYFDQLRNIEQNIGNYNEAIKAIDEGASTGVIQSKFPSMRTASVKLENVKNRLGLDVVGNTTFGALSESELKMALDTALPTNLKGPQLREWVVDKRDAQQKLADYLDNAIQFLNIPGNSIADLQASNPRASNPGQAAPEAGGLSAEDQQAMDWAKSNPDDPRAQQIIQMLGQ